MGDLRNKRNTKSVRSLELTVDVPQTKFPNVYGESETDQYLPQLRQQRNQSLQVLETIEDWSGSNTQKRTLTRNNSKILLQSKHIEPAQYPRQSKATGNKVLKKIRLNLTDNSPTNQNQDSLTKLEPLISFKQMYGTQLSKLSKIEERHAQLITQIDIEHAKKMNQVAAEFDDRIFKIKSFVDLCIVIDLTDSMQPYLSDQISNLILLIENFEKEHREINLRVGTICYRDFTLLDHLTYQNLTPELDRVNRFLSRCNPHSKFKEFNTAILKRKQQQLLQSFRDPRRLTEADSGVSKHFRDFQTTSHGLSSHTDVLLKLDVPEDIQGALNIAINKFSWDASERSSFILHIADAPAHGKQYHNEFDFYPDGSPEGHCLEEQMKRLAGIGINYQFVKMNESCDQMLRSMQQAVEEQNATNMFSVVEVKDSRNFGFYTLAFVFEQIQSKVKAIEGARTVEMQRLNKERAEKAKEIEIGWVQQEKARLTAEYEDYKRERHFKALELQRAERERKMAIKEKRMEQMTRVSSTESLKQQQPPIKQMDNAKIRQYFRQKLTDQRHKNMISSLQRSQSNLKLTSASELAASEQPPRYESVAINEKKKMLNPFKLPDVYGAKKIKHTNTLEKYKYQSQGKSLEIIYGSMDKEKQKKQQIK